MIYEFVYSYIIWSSDSYLCFPSNHLSKSVPLYVDQAWVPSQQQRQKNNNDNNSNSNSNNSNNSNNNNKNNNNNNNNKCNHESNHESSNNNKYYKALCEQDYL